MLLIFINYDRILLSIFWGYYYERKITVGEDFYFFSKGFINFSNNIFKQVFSSEEMIKLVTDNFHYLLDELPFGRVTASFNTVPSAFNESYKNYDYLIYTSDNYNDAAYIERVSNVDGSSAVINFYPEGDHVWTTAESLQLRTIAQVIITACAKSRLVGFMKKSSLTDLLTGAFNTAGWFRETNILYTHHCLQNYVCAFLNIKNFKVINKNVGSRYGDMILRLYAAKIKNFLSKEDVFARLGGDNFIVLVSRDRCEDFLDYISNIPIKIIIGSEEHTFNISTRCGLYDIVDDIPVSKIMNYLDFTIEQAKTSNHCNYFWFNKKEYESIIQLKDASLNFKASLKAHDFIVYYQPKVSLKDNSICGSEALVRLKKDGKVIPPISFIPILEKEGTIRDLDFYVLEQVCNDLNDTISKGLKPVKTSVNFSKVHLHDSDFAARIIQTIDLHNIDHSLIEIELTESSAYEDLNALISFIAELKKHNLAVSIDDFGTGYSSLVLLKNISVDVVKLDKPFVDDIDKEYDKDKVILKHIINLLNDINMEIVAEGVETSSQAEFLKNVGCNIIQGYLFDKPIPYEEFLERLRTRLYTI